MNALDVHDNSICLKKSLQENIKLSSLSLVHDMNVRSMSS